MRINKNLEKVLLILLTIAIFIGGFIAIVYGFLWIAQFIWFLQDNNFFGLPIWTFLGVLFLITAFINSIYNELKAKKLKPTRRNLINETKTQSIGFLIGGLILAFAIYLINLWKGFIFIFLISGLIYSMNSSFEFMSVKTFCEEYEKSSDKNDSNSDESRVCSILA